MENLPKIISSYPESDHNTDFDQIQNSYVNCNICRNFSNILKVTHRKSKEHQKKMTERFRSIRNQIKALRQNSIIVHDEEWKKKKESLYCYFCDKSVARHKISDGLMIESFGYMTHLASSDHLIAVKKYLKYHERKEKFELFIKTEVELNKFLERIPEARDTYLKKLDLLNMKDIQSIRDVEEQRKKLVGETVQNSVSSNGASAVIPVTQSHSTNNNLMVSVNKPVEPLPPWLLDGKEHNLSHLNISITPVIGPTIDTLTKHVTAQKKKGLPSKRLGVKQKPGEYSAKWMPDFRGVWNKGKRKYFN
ncbi:centrosomal AT-AC splicing factor isoform X2 [Parasteatoda tepidariorum]|uniref:centrosomal AT-AC splicing factor isoform X2 n=1 Tax=Parasteatoda tepidariorum TaxID=114398 RepID=UPI0039BC96A2